MAPLSWVKSVSAQIVLNWVSTARVRVDPQTPRISMKHLGAFALADRHRLAEMELVVVAIRRQVLRRGRRHQWVSGETPTRRGASDQRADTFGPEACERIGAAGARLEVRAQLRLQRSEGLNVEEFVDDHAAVLVDRVADAVGRRVRREVQKIAHLAVVAGRRPSVDRTGPSATSLPLWRVRYGGRSGLPSPHG